MNEQILKLAKGLSSNKDCVNADFTLTLNLKEVIRHGYVTVDGVSSIVYKKINNEGIKLIKDYLSETKVTNFNLTVSFREGTDGGDYSDGWYDCRFIFHGENKINVGFDMLSDYCGFIDSDFNRQVGDIKITEDMIDETIIKLVDLKNLLIENGNKLINHLNTFKK